jgi:hypothetical protein
MPPRNDDLHGNVADDSRVALVLVDVINDLEFEGADRLLPPGADHGRASGCAGRPGPPARVPVVYVNDNFGRWLLLRYLETETLVLTGLTGDRCARFTAADAFMRDFELFVPAEGTVSIEPEHNRHALAEMARLLDADLTDSTPLALAVGDQYTGAGTSSTTAVSARATSAACARISRACRLSSPAAQGSLTCSTPVAVSRSPREARAVHVPPRAWKKPRAATKRGRKSTRRAPRATPKTRSPAATIRATASPAAPMR